jgi:hypothetical protein
MTRTTKQKPGAPAPRRPRKVARPLDHDAPEEWGAKQGLGRTASYAAIRRGEVPTVRIGGRLWIPPDWREQVAAVALTEMQAKRQQHAARLEERGRVRAAEAETDEKAETGEIEDSARQRRPRHRRRRPEPEALERSRQHGAGLARNHGVQAKRVDT